MEGSPPGKLYRRWQKEIGGGKKKVRNWWRILRRVAAASLLVGLLVTAAVYGYRQLVRQPQPAARFFSVAVGRFDSPAIPPVAFLADDIESLASLKAWHANRPEWLPSPSRQQIELELARIRTAEGPLVVYLAGRFMRHGSQLYLLPADAHLDDARSWIPVQAIVDAIRESRSGPKLLLVDVAEEWSAIEYGIYDERTAAELTAALAAVPDDDLTVLLAASNDRRGVLPALRRSIFAFCVEQGLAGMADGCANDHRDGKVSVRELTHYVIAQAQNIARSVGEGTQRAEVVRRGTDFVLTACSDGSGAVPELEDDREYPPALMRAWQTLRGNVHGKKLQRFGFLVRCQTALALRAEEAWRCGLPLEQIQAGLLSRFWELESWMAGQPVPEVTLPSAFARSPNPDPKWRAVVRDALYRDKAAAVAAREIAGADVSTLAAAAVVELADTDPLSDAEIRRAAALLDTGDSKSADLFETLLLRELAAGGSHENRPNSLTRLLLKTACSAERISAHLSAVPWVLARLKRASASRHEGELCYWLRPFVAAEHVRRRLHAAEAEFEKAFRECQVVEQAEQRLAYASWFLPFWLETSLASDQFPVWEQACATAEELYRQLSHRPQSTDDLRAWIDHLQTSSDRLADGVRRLEAPFSGASVRSLLVRQAGGRRTSLAHVRRLLRTPFVAPEDRAKLVRLADRMHRSSAKEALASVARYVPNASAAADPHERDGTPAAQWRLRIKGVVSLFRLAGLDEAAFDSIEGQVSGLKDNAFAATKRKVGQAVSRIWREEMVKQHRRDPSVYYRDRLSRFLPVDAGLAMNSARLLSDGLRYREERLKEAAAFFAANYRHRARDFRGCGITTSATASFAAFYRRAAQRLASFAPPAPVAAVRFSSTESPIRLKKSHPVRTEVLVHRTAADKGASSNDWRVALLPQPSLEVTRTHSTGTQQLTGDAYRLSLLVKQRGSFRVPGKLGFVIRAERDGESYHYVLPAEAEVEKRLSAILSDDQRPEEFVQRRLRISPSRGGGTGYHLLVRNDGATPVSCFAELHLDANVVAIATAPLVIAPGRTQEVPLDATGKEPITFLPNRKLAIVLKPAKDAKTILARIPVPIEIIHPTEYTAIKEVAYRCNRTRDGTFRGHWEAVVTRFEGARSDGRATIELIDGPAVVRFDDSRSHGRWLPGGSRDLPLSLDSIAIDVKAPPAGRIGLNVDGVRWCYVFDTVFHSGTKHNFRANPRLTRKPVIHIPLPSLSDPSLPIPPVCDLRVANAPRESRLEYRIERIWPARETVSRGTFPDSVRRELSLRIADGAVRIHAAIESRTIDVSGLRREGKYRISARLTDDVGVELATATQTMIVDGSPPSDLRFIGLPDKVAMGSPLAFGVSGRDLAGVERVEVTFAFEPQQGKPMPPRTLEARPDPADPASWLVTLELPDQPGTATFALAMTDRLSHTSKLERKVTVFDARPKPKPTLLTGRVWIGTLPQPGLVVELTDASGKRLGRTVTDSAGRFTFRNLPAGRYRLSSSRRGSMRAGTVTVDVLPHRQNQVDLRLSLLAGPR